MVTVREAIEKSNKAMTELDAVHDGYRQGRANKPRRSSRTSTRWLSDESAGPQCGRRSGAGGKPARVLPWWQTKCGIWRSGPRFGKDTANLIQDIVNKVAAGRSWSRRPTTPSAA